MDGTNNFLHGLLFYSVSIALQMKGEITEGVIYNPILN
ncbi:inositol monophosphatase family protein [Coxiella-like endosymbiont of Rhipicephalus sanguineus]